MSEQSLKRDNQGRFIKEQSKTEGTANVFSKLIKAGASNNDETLIDVKVTNPLHRISQLLAEIKNHQSTTFSFRFTIPLIALPIFLMVAFQLGRAQTSCSQVFSSKVGTIVNLQVQAPKDTPNPILSLFSFLPSIPKIEPESTLVNQKKSVLIDTQGNSYNVVFGQNLNLIPFEGKTIVLSGTLSECTRSITLDSPQNISSLD